jgi:NSS family neurotransmitter:Na+ symporter
MGLMMTYGAYLSADVSIGRSSFVIAGADTLVALLAGMAIFPLVFANGLDPAEGPGLIFVTLPIAFANMPAGALFGTVFFLLLTFAALTSAISILEPLVSWLKERPLLNRVTATVGAGIVAWLIGLMSVASFNVWSGVYPLDRFPMFAGKTLYDLIDYATANVMMPLGGMLIAIFAGWRMSRSALLDELGITETRGFKVWLFLCRYIAPLAILAIFIANLA